MTHLDNATHLDAVRSIARRPGLQTAGSRLLLCRIIRRHLPRPYDTCPSYAVDPYTTGGRKGAVNAANFLAGGVAFSTPAGTFVSPNLTPDPAKENLPDGGHTFEQFKRMMRTGHDADPPHDILQVMPWPIYGNMTDEDLFAVYAYLRAIPHAEMGNFFGGNCPAPGIARPPI